MDYPDELRRLRTAAGLTQTALAAKIGVTSQQISAVETRANGPSVPLFIAWADACGQPVRFGPDSLDAVADADDQRILRDLVYLMRVKGIPAARLRVLGIELGEWIAEFLKKSDEGEDRRVG